MPWQLRNQPLLVSVGHDCVGQRLETTLTSSDCWPTMIVLATLVVIVGTIVLVTLTRVVFTITASVRVYTIHCKASHIIVARILRLRYPSSPTNANVQGPFVDALTYVCSSRRPGGKTMLPF